MLGLAQALGFATLFHFGFLQEFPEFRNKTEFSDMPVNYSALNWSFFGEGRTGQLWHRHCFKGLRIRLLRNADG
jgi:hypothetical protein